jgi:hypothetical protein
MAEKKIMMGMARRGTYGPCKAKDPMTCKFHSNHQMMTRTEAAEANEALLECDPSTHEKTLRINPLEQKANGVIMMLLHHEDDAMNLIEFDEQGVIDVLNGTNLDEPDRRENMNSPAAHQVMDVLYKRGVLAKHPEIVRAGLTATSDPNMYINAVQKLQLSGLDNHDIIALMPDDYDTLYKMKKDLDSCHVYMAMADDLNVDPETREDAKSDANQYLAYERDAYDILFKKMSTALVNNTMHGQLHSYMVRDVIDNPRLDPRAVKAVLMRDDVYKDEDQKIDVVETAMEGYWGSVRRAGDKLEMDDYQPQKLSDKVKANIAFDRFYEGGLSELQDYQYDMTKHTETLWSGYASTRECLLDGNPRFKEFIKANAKQWQESEGIPLSTKIKLMFKGYI